ncbi:MAG: IMP dehydrogenase [Patescibacteria group bacterium]
MPRISKIIGEGLTFDDVLLVPGYSKIHPRKVQVGTRLTRKIRLNIPIVSAAMDTVTEAELAIALAREGGLGIIHKNMSIAEQARHVDRVKRSQSGLIPDPITLRPDQTVGEARRLMKKYRFSGFPVVDGKKLVGILTSRDLRFVKRDDRPVKEVMTAKNLVTAHVGISLARAEEILHENRIEKLPIVDRRGHLKGLITFRDIQKRNDFPNACKDEQGRLRVGAAVGVSADTMERVAALVGKHVDVIVVDTAHAHSKGALETIKKIRKVYPGLQLIGGNIATAAAARSLIRLGVDAIKIGMGPSAICTTRIIAGVGVPQLTAIMDCAKVAAEAGIPLIADGGIKFSGDIAKAIAAGADSVMIGSLFAGTDESPGEIVYFEGKNYKTYRGMGSLEAMKKGSADRYGQDASTDESKLVPEGIEGRVSHIGSLASNIYQLMGGLRAGMGYCGAATIEELKAKGRFIRITNAGLRESHPHDINITKEAPNYRTS